MRIKRLLRFLCQRPCLTPIIFIFFYLWTWYIFHGFNLLFAFSLRHLLNFGIQAIPILFPLVFPFKVDFFFMFFWQLKFIYVDYTPFILISWILKFFIQFLLRLFWTFFENLKIISVSFIIFAFYYILLIYIFESCHIYQITVFGVFILFFRIMTFT